MPGPESWGDELAALFRGKRAHNSRRYTLERIGGQLVFRLAGFDAVFEATLKEMDGRSLGADDYNTIVVTIAGPKRFYDAANDRAQSTTAEQWEFFGRS